MIFTVFKKDLMDTLRDRRTLITTLVIPTLLFPVLMNISFSITNNFSEKAAKKKIQIGIVGEEQHFIAQELRKLSKSERIEKIICYKDTLAMMGDLKKDSIQMGLLLPPQLANTWKNLQTANVNVYFDLTDMGMDERAKKFMAIIEKKALDLRLKDLKVNTSQITPLQTNYQNIASDKEMIGKMAGGMLPYIFIIFGFLGCMYPSIDLFTGEKERGTIETLLTTPVQRWQLLFGKMGVVVLFGMLAATCALLGLFFSIEFMDLVKDQELLNVAHSILSPGFLLVLYSLLLPLIIFFAGVMIPLAVYAKSFKEAQSIITPLNIVMLIPAMIGLMPGIEYNSVTACIPVLNISLATKELIAGTLNYGLVAISFLVMIALAFIAVGISYKRFDNETNIVL